MKEEIPVCIKCNTRATYAKDTIQIRKDGCVVLCPKCGAVLSYLYTTPTKNIYFFPNMTNCKHFFGRTVKDGNGIPYDYEMGCLVGGNIANCGAHCKLFESLPPTTYTTTKSK